MISRPLGLGQKPIMHENERNWTVGRVPSGSLGSANENIFNLVTVSLCYNCCRHALI